MRWREETYKSKTGLEREGIKATWDSVAPKRRAPKPKTRQEYPTGEEGGKGKTRPCGSGMPAQKRRGKDEQVERWVGRHKGG
mmetsp:Transcript_42480/g.78563  ORF Transcript_42480/g.78563 Transcript_42480/m.78563 type:complete len:82 (+) Transcript_42480:184-429(+)|eukprot:CAMPEP_0197469546 /NCGR_PEP_ID=MMETSP1175-20131217/66660_1 /TAXON_ID=1003142 /ORGANISM="Triceratium dubium, Strain CCMP147" /LENGTH=81 /DNA_ID=CAMNT_0043005695 /DNA_START=505 /DNA_END=750 /DNA_ORIENTATION=+